MVDNPAALVPPAPPVTHKKGGCCSSPPRETEHDPVTSLMLGRLYQVDDNFKKLFRFEELILDKKAFAAKQKTNKTLVDTIKKGFSAKEAYDKVKVGYDK